VDSVSILRNIFVNLKNSGEKQTMKINQLEGELSKVKAELRESRVANLPGCALPSRGGIGQIPTSSTQNQLPSIGGAKKLYSEVVNTSVDKRYKVLVKSKLNLLTETIKNALKTNVNPTVMKVGVRSFKSLKDG
jgi:ribosomal protein L29